MARASLTLIDDGDEVRVTLDFDPPMSAKPDQQTTNAQYLAAVALNAITDAMKESNNDD